MLKKTITYTDYNGVSRTEDFYFNLTKAELITMEATTEGGLQARLGKIIAANDNVAVMNEFIKLIKMSYGVKSEDGRRFIKSEEISKEFMETEAYSEFLMELCTDDQAAANFVNAVVPDLK